MPQQPSSSQSSGLAFLFDLDGVHQEAHFGASFGKVGDESCADAKRHLTTISRNRKPLKTATPTIIPRSRG
jgi:hypothetical protein